MSSHQSATAHLNEVHQAQVQAYLKYFRNKLDQQTKEVDTAFRDTLSMRCVIRAHAACSCVVLFQMNMRVLLSPLCFVPWRLLTLSLRCFARRLLEEVYSQDDVTNILNGLRDIVKSNVRAEFEKYAHQTALYLRLLLLQAEARSATLKVDTSLLDDECADLRT